jgi:hypothetical protein
MSYGETVYLCSPTSFVSTVCKLRGVLDSKVYMIFLGFSFKHTLVKIPTLSFDIITKQESQV